MTRIKQVLLVVALVLMARGPGTPPLRALVPRPVSRHSACGKHIRMDVQIKALATPVAQQEVTLQISAMNRGLVGPFEARVRFPEGALEPLEGPLSWIRELPLNEPQSWSTRVRVLKNGPIALTVKVRPVVCPPTTPNAEGYVTLFPFEVREGVLHPTWNEETMPRLSEPPAASITLPNGDRAIVAGGAGRLVL